MMWTIKGDFCLREAILHAFDISRPQSVPGAVLLLESQSPNPRDSRHICFQRRTRKECQWMMFEEAGNLPSISLF